MKIYPSLRLQLRDHAPALIVYYSVLMSMVLLSLILIPFMNDKDNISLHTNGVTAVTMIFAFICSLCAFKDIFLMNLQHGVSRKTQFLARLGTMGAVCAILALADEAYTLLLTGLEKIFPDVFMGSSLYWMLYSFDGSSPKGPFFDIVFSFFAFLAVCSLGYLITVFNYRLNKLGKVVFWAGTPAVILTAAGVISENPSLQKAVVIPLMDLLGLCFGSFPHMIVTCTVAAAVCSGLAWLLMRRAAAK